MSSGQNNTNSYPTWAPRFWHGMPSKVWIPQLVRNRFQVRLTRLHIAAGVSAFMPFTDLMAASQHVLFGRAIANTQLPQAPIFVLGHWRSGTTLLHELLGFDDRFASPTTFQCFAPWHFLLTEAMVTRFFGWVLPDKRPMDNMKAGWSLPQEDEFALMNLGAPTPYTYMMFPQHGFVDENTLASDTFEPEQLARWKYLFDWFLKALTYKTAKPLILKSPPHTGRIGILREMYPDAKFIHIVRDPRKLYPSTVKLWKSLESIQGLQRPHTDEELQPFVFRCLNRMYDAFEVGRQGLLDSQIIDVRYEDLVANPTGVVESIYQQLELGGFDSIRDSLAKRTQDEKEYKTNSFGLDKATETIVLQNWKSYAERYGYA